MTDQEIAAGVAALRAFLGAGAAWTADQETSAVRDVLSAAETARGAGQNPVETVFRILTQNSAELQDLIARMGGIGNILAMAPDLIRIFRVVTARAAAGESLANIEHSIGGRANHGS